MEDHKDVMKNRAIKIVILGTGFAGLYTYFRLHKHYHGSKNVQITLISEHDYFLFITLLHEVATGSLLPLNITQSIRSLSLCCLHKFIQGKVLSANFEKSQVTVKKEQYEVHAHTNRKDTNEVVTMVEYDYLVSALGSTANFFNTPGAQKYSLTLKNLKDSKLIKNRLIDNFAYANELVNPKEQKGQLRFVIVGGGPTGVEIAGEIADYINHEMYKAYPDLKGMAEVILTQSASQLLPQVNKWFDRKAQNILKNKMNVNVLFNTRVTEVMKDGVIMGNKKLRCGMVIWTAGVKANYLEIFSNTPVEREKRSERIKVNQYLQIESYPNVFVVGDQAWICDKEKGVPYPMRAQFAVREGIIAGENIYNLIQKKPKKEFQWHDIGFVVSLGKGGALSDIFGLRTSGPLAWWLYRTAYLVKIVGWRAKFRTLVEWTLNLFLPRDVSKL